jgi:hypothetical protein
MNTKERPSRSQQHHSLLVWLGAGLVLFVAKNVSAAEYYVATTGSDSNPGTQASPFASLQKANTSATAGDTIWLRAGTYFSTTQITLSKSGTSDTNRTKIWAYPGEVPVLDCSKYQTTNTAANVPAILVTGSWMHLKGLEIANGKVGASGDHSYSMLQTKNAHNDIFELLNIHHGFGAGLFIDDTNGGGGHLILNCDSHDNYDINGSQGDGQNADGFGHHYQTSGATSTFRGCRSWWNSDDGYDFIYQDVPLIVENCWAMGSGYSNYGTGNPTSGNGNGFKMGGNVTNTRHMVRNSVAWRNKANGFYSNHSTGGHTWYNNTSFQNGTNFNMLSGPSAAPIQLTGALAHILRNNLGYPTKNSNMGGVDTAFNTWDLNITPKATDFLSITDTTVSGTGQAIEATSLALGPRQADGSLPNIDFLKLAAGSQMIDKGTNVGLPYVGAAPDLGAYEYGAAGSSGGGAAGTGGRANTTGGSPPASTGGNGAVTGGRASTGGAPSSTGGAGVATGGRTNTGGGAVNNTGGAVAATGGIVSTGGAPVNTGGVGVVTGGRNGSGGTNATGGVVVATGGVANIGGLAASGGAVTATGGIENNAGTPGSGTEVTTSGGAGNSTDTGSCSCRVAGLRSRSTTLAGVGLLGLLMLRSRRRRSPR